MERQYRTLANAQLSYSTRRRRTNGRIAKEGRKKGGGVGKEREREDRRGIMERRVEEKGGREGGRGGRESKGIVVGRKSDRGGGRGKERICDVAGMQPVTASRCRVIVVVFVFLEQTRGRRISGGPTANRVGWGARARTRARPTRVPSRD